MGVAEGFSSVGECEEERETVHASTWVVGDGERVGIDEADEERTRKAVGEVAG